jgi:hypothetical protein
MIFKTYQQREQNHTSIYRGVSFVKRRSVNPWRAKLAGKIIGYFATQEDAARHYDSVSIATMGAQFAITNFPTEP